METPEQQTDEQQSDEQPEADEREARPEDFEDDPARNPESDELDDIRGG